MTLHQIEVTLRIPGIWSSFRALAEALPADCKLAQDQLTMQDGSSVEVNIRQADDQFVSVFASSCRRQPTEKEKELIEDYTVQVCLTGPGGSLENASAMMRAAGAILHAGGAGVFIDNSGLAFGATHWLEMSQMADAEAISFAFVNIIRGRNEVYTLGLHLLGLPDLLMRAEDIGEDGDVIIEMIQYLCSCEKEIGDGHIIADERGPRYFVAAVKDEKMNSKSPMHNPWGRLRLVSTNEICESN